MRSFITSIVLASFVLAFLLYIISDFASTIERPDPLWYHLQDPIEDLFQEDESQPANDTCSTNASSDPSGTL